MVVRRAKTGDAERVHSIAKSLRINYVRPQNSGFLVYILPQEQYEDHIQRSPYFYVHGEREVDGFLMCYDSETLQSLRSLRKLDHEDALIGFILDQETPFVFGDQIGISGDKRQHTGKSMMNKLFGDMRLAGIPTMYVGILHNPVRNTPSINFVQDLGFSEIGEITTKDDHVWGVYRLYV